MPSLVSGMSMGFLAHSLIIILAFFEMISERARSCSASTTDLGAAMVILLIAIYREKGRKNANTGSMAGWQARE